MELGDNIDEDYKKSSERFFKEKISSYGVRTDIVRKIAKKYFKEIKNLDKKKIFDICEDMFATSCGEEAIIATQWLGDLKDIWSREDFENLDRFYGYVDNWGKCDDFCLRVLSHFIVLFPEFKDEVKGWSESGNKWRRRASAVAFIQGGLWRIHGKYLKDVFDVANKLLCDEEDLVQKGYGWMLKIAAEDFRDEVFDFVIERKNVMPRTALRYAIEKMSIEMKRRAMGKN